MFDDPRKELERLQKELLAAEEEEPGEKLEEFDDLEDLDLDGTLESVDWDGAHREPLSRSYTREKEDEDVKLWNPGAEIEETLRQEEEPPKKEKKSYIGLKFAIALELLAIAGLFWWWYLWIR